MSELSLHSNGGSRKEAAEGDVNRIVATRMLCSFHAKNAGKGSKNDIDIYQALEFRKGSDMPIECREGLSEKERSAIWVHGVYYAPASVIRRANKELRKDRYIFQKDTRDDWEPCPQYKAALGSCPELVRGGNYVAASRAPNLRAKARYLRKWAGLALSVWRDCDRKPRLLSEILVLLQTIPIQSKNSSMVEPTVL